MKGTLYDIKGNKKSEVEMPELFSQKIREDIVAKYFEADKLIQPYAPYKEAGRRHSASGRIRHRRHEWGGHYGKGISRVPRKTMWRRGNQFFWIGAEIASARGGRRAHGPEGIGKEKKINKKEMKIAYNSGFAATADSKHVLGRYGNLEKLELKLPIVVESKLDNIKSKEIFSMLKEIFKDAFLFVIKRKELRSGKGSRRGRKYKSNAGLLFVKAKGEKIKAKGFDVKDAGDVVIADLYPLGRFAVYTEKALKEIGEKEK